MIVTRKLGERVFLDTADGRVEVTIVGWTPHVVRVGIAAPQSVRIIRDDAKSTEPKRDA